jgi:hypothetical protein
MPDYYRTPGEWIAPFTLFLAAGVTLATSQHRERFVSPMRVVYATAVGEPSMSSELYTQSSSSLSEDEQIEALRSFAGTLSAGTIDLPQSAVNLLNERFWDLL